MSHHPTLSQLEALLGGTLPPEQAKDVIIHVLWSCKSCKAVAMPRFVEFLSQEFSDNPSVEEDVYEEALNRAISASFGHQTLVDKILSNLAQGRASLVLEEYSELPCLAFYQAFLQKSWDLRYQDPRRMVTLAQAAVTVSEEMLEPEIYGAKEVKDFQCRAWIENGNALRVADDLAQAELAFSYALKLLKEGTGDKFLEARFHDCAASFFADIGRHEAALASLDLVYSLHTSRGDKHLAGRALISKGCFVGDRGDCGLAIRFLQEGLAMIDQVRDPALVWVAIHSQLCFLVDSGRYREGRRLLPRARSSEAYPGEVNILKVRWLEGRINAGLDKLACSERDLKVAMHGFADLGRRYDSALASLDLSAVFLRQGKLSEAKEAGLRAADILYTLKIRAELEKAVHLVQRVLQLEIATVAFLEEIANFLRRAENDPTARFDLAD